MKPIPTLETKRLTLRAFRLDDAAEVQRLAGDRSIADTTLNIPHPYQDGMAQAWISIEDVELYGILKDEWKKGVNKSV
jgi:[ribosomal protein S5]-alanine N-acetyltransferase